jgi:cell wall-active antibiotic response 4TMS protein YvqF
MADYKPADDRLTRRHETQYDPTAYPVVPETARGGVVSFLSSTEREGRWELPRHFRALAVLGNVELDLRDAVIGIGVSVIEAVAVMGNIEIAVPPDVAVESDGDSLLGSFVVKYKGSVTPASATGLRTVRVIGTAYASSVEICVKGPDEGMLKRLRKMSLKRTLAAGESSE